MKLSDEELDGILLQAGLKLSQPHDPKGKYRKDAYLFTTCRTCGTEAHYRLKYILDKNAIGEPVCRACYWLSWYGESHALYDRSVRKILAEGVPRSELIRQGVITQEHDATWAQAESLAQENGYDLVDLIHGARPGDDVLVVRCQACGRQTAERPYDVKFGCMCGGKKTGGVVYGKEAVTPTTAREDRKTAPRTPGAASVNAWVERHVENPSKYGFSDLRGKSAADFPELAEAWEDDSKPEEVPADSYMRVHLRCPKGHHPYQTPGSYLIDGCMVCRSQRTKSSSTQSCLRETNPELAEEWVEAKDGPRYTPDTVKSGSKRKVLWRCIACGHEWVDTVRNRELRMNNRCPSCGKVMGSLAWQYPELAEEWSPDNPVSPWNTKPHGQLDFTPKWVCRNNPEHVWAATTATRIKGGKPCPWCSKKKG